MEGWLAGWLQRDGWVERCTDGRLNEWVNGQMGACVDDGTCTRMLLP